ncbi:MAG: cytochrome c [Acidobacteria bacterium]|nr:cytochrome c [Acidobacteriota bacterium]
MRNVATTWTRGIAFAALGLGFAACQQDMANQPRHKPLDASTFFKDGRASRPPVPGTVARGQLREDDHLYTGKVNGQLTTTFPFPVTRTVMQRGRERFGIYCTPCHGALGDGRGVIVSRGLKQPPSFHIDRLRQAPPGHFFDVMTNGLGAMQDYSAQVTVEDRWAIVAYIRALQLSQNATINDVPAVERPRLEKEREKKP